MNVLKKLTSEFPNFYEIQNSL